MPDRHGNLFGVAGGGPNAQGVVFELHPNANGSWSEATVHAFTDGEDGYTQCFATGGLLVDDSTGILYGVASGGNPGGACSDGEVEGCGLVYSLTPNGGSWTYRILYNFNDNGTNGRDPVRPLLQDASGAHYGATYAEGPSPDCDCGVVFKLMPTKSGEWNFNLIHAFTNVPDGANASTGLVRDAQNNLWGATSSGGDASCHRGTIYEVSGDTESVIHTFAAAPAATGRIPLRFSIRPVQFTV